MVLWNGNLSGTTNQHSSPGLLDNSQNEIAINVSQSMDGAIAHRLGTKLYLNSLNASQQVRGLDMFQKNDGSNYFQCVVNGDLYVHGAITWTLQQTGAFAASSNIDFANFVGRHYMASSSSSEYLSYVTETGSKTTVSGNVEGQYLAVNGAYMIVSGGTTEPRKSFFSNVDSDTFTTGTDFFRTSLPPTGVAAFGSGRPFIIFTNKNYLICDPATNYSNEINGFGCVSHRSIQNIRGRLIWLSRQGFFALSMSDTYPTEISLPIKNSLTGDAIFNQIAGSNFTVAASGQIESRYYCALGNLSATVKGKTINSCIVEFDTSQGTWKVHTFTTNDIGSVFAQFIDSNGNRNLYAGSRSTGTVYKMEASGIYTDDDSTGTPVDITMTYRIKHVELTDREGPVYVSKIDKLWLKYKSPSIITVAYSYDGASTFTAAPANFPVYTTTNWNVDYVHMNKSDCNSSSFEFTGTGNCIIYGVGIDVSERRRIGGIKGE